MSDDLVSEEHVPSGNLFLDSLPVETVARFRGSLEHVELPLGQLIVRGGDHVTSVDFPLTACLSAVNVMDDGTSIEVMFIGREGLYGTQLALGDPLSGYEVTVQVMGSALRMGSDAFLELLESESALRKRTLTYVQTLILSMSQFLGCNRLHVLDARLARWLLMCHDRVAGNTVAVTHEFLSEMLGVRRPGITVALQTIQATGAIEQGRAVVLIRDRAALLRLSCECYQKINGSLERLLGYSVVK